ncbi:MAG TPA: hypothetical protein VGM90_07680 [Kofleriaceae bacterium]|jgi:hypothetical protein
MRRALFLGLLVACGDDHPTYQDPASIEVASYAAVASNKLDVLFQMDNTALDMQVNFVDSLAPLFPAIASILGPQRSLHIGVVTSDMGTSTSMTPTPAFDLGGCKGKGLDGALVNYSQSTTELYLVDEVDGQGAPHVNYTGDLLSTVGTMLEVGALGCGFEQILAGTQRAFENPVNAGFVRDDANLLVVMISDEDDCSVRDQSIFTASPELGDLQSYRCTHYGVVCDQPIDSVGTKTGCHANEESQLIDPIGPYVERLKSVKSDPARVAVYAMSGPPTPFAIELRTPPGVTGPPEPALAHSCAYQGNFGPEVADPAVRLAEFAAGFGANGAFADDCAVNLTPRMAGIAQLVKNMSGVVCLDTTRLGDSDTLPGVQPLCTVEVDTGPSSTPRAIPACDGASDDCFEITTDETACPDTTDHARLVVHVSTPSPDEYVRASCFAPS